MSFVENVLNLIDKNGITKNKMLKDLGLAKGSVVNWQERGTIPNGETLSKIAAYFNVTTDYLLGNEQKEKAIPNRDSLIEEAIDIMNSLPEDVKAAALVQLKALAALSDKKRKK